MIPACTKCQIQGQCFLGVLTTALFNYVFGFGSHGTRKVCILKILMLMSSFVQPPLITLSRNLRQLPLDWVAGAVLVDGSGGRIDRHAKRSATLHGKQQTRGAWARALLIDWIIFWGVVSVIFWVIARCKQRAVRSKRDRREMVENDLEANKTPDRSIHSGTNRRSKFSPTMERRSSISDIHSCVDHD